MCHICLIFLFVPCIVCNVFRFSFYHLYSEWVVFADIFCIFYFPHTQTCVHFNIIFCNSNVNPARIISFPQGKYFYHLFKCIFSCFREYIKFHNPVICIIRLIFFNNRVDNINTIFVIINSCFMQNIYTMLSEIIIIYKITSFLYPKIQYIPF